ncbi:TolC family protein [Planktomarina temperata]|nr:TolC family protein [Planktomarina temperata]
MVKYFLGITLSIILSGCMGNTYSKHENTKTIPIEKRQSIKKDFTPLVQQLLLDPEVTRLLFAKNEKKLQLNLLMAELGPMVTASSSAGGIIDNDDQGLSGTVQVGVSKDADLNNLFDVKKDIIENDVTISNVELIRALNLKIHTVLVAINSLTAADQKLEILKQGLQEYGTVKKLIDKSHQVGVITKGQYLKIQGQLNDIEMVLENLELQKENSKQILAIELGESYKDFMPAFNEGLSKIEAASFDKSLDDSVLKLNAAILDNIDNNIILEKNSQLWNGEYRASLSSVIGDDASGFLGINLTKPVYDGGRSEARIALLKSKRFQAETEEKKVYKEVSLALFSLQANKSTAKKQASLLREKLENLLAIKKDLEVRQNSGKAQLEDVAQNYLDVANAKIQVIDSDSLLLKSKIDYVLLQQRAYDYILTGNEITQIIK